MVVDFVASGSGGPRDPGAIVEKLKRRSKDDFKSRPFEASLILQAVSWYLRYPLSYRDIEELFRERGLVVDRASRTSCCRSASDFRRPTKRKIGVGTAYRAAYARVCDKPLMTSAGKR